MTLLTEPTLHVVGMFVSRGETKQQFQNDIPHSKYSNEEYSFYKYVNYAFHFFEDYRP